MAKLPYSFCQTLVPHLVNLLVFNTKSLHIRLFARWWSTAWAATLTLRGELVSRGEQQGGGIERDCSEQYNLDLATLGLGRAGGV